MTTLINALERLTDTGQTQGSYSTLTLQGIVESLGVDRSLAVVKGACMTHVQSPQTSAAVTELLSKVDILEALPESLKAKEAQAVKREPESKSIAQSLVQPRHGKGLH